jgi:hypothetical protein
MMDEPLDMEDEMTMNTSSEAADEARRLREALQIIINNKDNKNWRKPDIIIHVETTLRRK